MDHRDLTPEHTKRGSIDHEMPSELNPEIIGAAYDYVDSILGTANVTTQYKLYGQMWYGRALREAFLAGISYAERGKGE
ncbi:MAG: hypothetical protein ABIP04_14230 [Sulfuriferula sp.]